MNIRRKWAKPYSFNLRHIWWGWYNFRVKLFTHKEYHPLSYFYWNILYEHWNKNHITTLFLALRRFFMRIQQFTYCWCFFLIIYEIPSQGSLLIKCAAHTCNNWYKNTSTILESRVRKGVGQDGVDLNMYQITKDS